MKKLYLVNIFFFIFLSLAFSVYGANTKPQSAESSYLHSTRQVLFHVKLSGVAPGSGTHALLIIESEGEMAEIHNTNLKYDYGVMPIINNDGSVSFNLYNLMGKNGARKTKGTYIETVLAAPAGYSYSKTGGGAFGFQVERVGTWKQIANTFHKIKPSSTKTVIRLHFLVQKEQKV
jgi:hypothetical protein